jgi:hypothetical protein
MCWAIVLPNRPLPEKISKKKGKTMHLCGLRAFLTRAFERLFWLVCIAFVFERPDCRRAGLAWTPSRNSEHSSVIAIALCLGCPRGFEDDLRPHGMPRHDGGDIGGICPGGRVLGCSSDRDKSRSHLAGSH